MSLQKNDPLYYKQALNKLVKQAKDNNVKVHIKYNQVLFDDEQDGILTTRCAVTIECMNSILQ